MSNGNFNFVKVPSHYVEDVWAHVVPHFANGERYWDKFYSLDAMKQNLLNGTQQLWMMLEEKKVLCSVITQIDVFPEVKSLRICYIGGNGLYPGMMKDLRKIEDWGKKNGCSIVDIMGRDEWERLLGKQGYKAEARVYRKELM